MDLLIVDNFDSFTFTLVYYFESILRKSVTVCRYDKLAVDDLGAFSHIVLSPGPGLPRDYPLLHEMVLALGGTKRILGICLGHQVIGEAFGGRLKQSLPIGHGVQSAVIHDGDGLFKGVTSPFCVGRYHSWEVDRDSLPGYVEVIASTAEGIVMGMRHKHLDVTSLQFHPESVMTDFGFLILSNWLGIKMELDLL